MRRFSPELLYVQILPYIMTSKESSLKGDIVFNLIKDYFLHCIDRYVKRLDIVKSYIIVDFTPKQLVDVGFYAESHKSLRLSLFIWLFIYYFIDKHEEYCIEAQITIVSWGKFLHI